MVDELTTLFGVSKGVTTRYRVTVKTRYRVTNWLRRPV
jgi:hypothetical protein